MSDLTATSILVPELEQVRIELEMIALYNSYDGDDWVQREATNTLQELTVATAKIAKLKQELNGYKAGPAQARDRDANDAERFRYYLGRLFYFGSDDWPESFATAETAEELCAAIDAERASASARGE